eukprot:tig00000449_g963.t1
MGGGAAGSHGTSWLAGWGAASERGGLAAWLGGPSDGPAGQALWLAAWDAASKRNGLATWFGGLTGGATGRRTAVRLAGLHQQPRIQPAAGPSRPNRAPTALTAGPTETFPHVFLCPERPTASQRRRQEPSLPPTWSQSSSASRTTTPKRAATMTLLERARRLWSRRCDINAEWERDCRISQASKKRPRPPRTGARARERARGPRTCKETAHRSTRAGRRRSAPKSSTIASRHH